MKKIAYDPCERGPFPVGVRTFVMEDGSREGRRLEVEVWYPGTEDARGKDLDPETQAKKPLAVGQMKGKITQAAVSDVALRGDSGPYPLLVFSHGHAGFRFQSTFFTTHVASHGYIVAAPDHAGNTFFEVMRLRKTEDQIRNLVNSRKDRPRDMSFILDQLLDSGTEAGQLFLPVIDTEKIGMSGHSFGGYTTLAVARHDARLKLLLPMAPPPEAEIPLFAYDEGELEWGREIPTLLMAAEFDSLINYQQLRGLFEKIPCPKQILTLKNADHFHFCDEAAFIHNLFYVEIAGRLSEQQRESVLIPMADAKPIETLLDPKVSEDVIKGAGLAFLDMVFRDKADAREWLSRKSLEARFEGNALIEKEVKA
jgi:dienelactone hydrolase